MRRAPLTLIPLRLGPLFALFFSGLLAPPAIGDWAAYPDALPQFDFSGDELEKQWSTVRRGTVQPYPAVEWVGAQLNHQALCEATGVALHEHPTLGEGLPDACTEFDDQAIAGILQQAWRDVARGDYQSAATAAEALGPLGYPVGGYARVIYARELARSIDEQTEILDVAIARAKDYAALFPNSAYSLFVSAHAKFRILEGLPNTEGYATGYITTIHDNLEQLIFDYPAHARGAASFGGFNAYIIAKSGTFLARASYNAVPEKMESGFSHAMRVEPLLLSTHVDYAIALRQVYRKKARAKLRQVLENVGELTPLDAEDALAQQRASRLLAEIGSESRLRVKYIDFVRACSEKSERCFFNASETLALLTSVTKSSSH